MKTLTLPAVTKTAPKVGVKYYTINLDKSAPKLHYSRILSRTWSGGTLDQKRLANNLIFASFAGANAARKAIFKALSENK